MDMFNLFLESGRTVCFLIFFKKTAVLDGRYFVRRDYDFFLTYMFICYFNRSKLRIFFKQIYIFRIFFLTF